MAINILTVDLNPGQEVALNLKHVNVESFILEKGRTYYEKFATNLKSLERVATNKNTKRGEKRLSFLARGEMPSLTSAVDMSPPSPCCC